MAVTLPSANTLAPVLRVATFDGRVSAHKVAAAHERKTARDYFDDFAARDIRGMMRENRAAGL